ncbi:MAG: hypothetical protein E6L04_01320 [Thaumarchaeota archaeon]|nr:MAG: hypothetical protein E6L04_01320 [Nitrososphaerota archaeon]
MTPIDTNRIGTNRTRLPKDDNHCICPVTVFIIADPPTRKSRSEKSLKKILLKLNKIKVKNLKISIENPSS